MGPADREPQRPTQQRSNRVLFSLGYEAYCDSRHVAMAAVGEGGRNRWGSPMSSFSCKGPMLSLPPPGVQWGAVSSPTALGRSVQFHWRDLSECLLGAGLSLLRNTSLQENTLPLPSYGKWTQKKDLFFTLSNFTFEVYSRTYMEREVKDT